MPPAGGAGDELSQAYAALADENARLRARLIQAGIEARHTADATADSALRGELRRADAAMLEREHLVRRVTDAMPGIVTVFDLGEQRSIFANRAVADVLGYRQPPLIASVPRSTRFTPPSCSDR